MALPEIFKGSAANDKTGTPARQGADIINQNFKTLESEIIELKNPDAVLKKGNIETTGLNVHVDAGAFEWRIAQFEFLDNPEFDAVLDAATDGYHRKDLLLGDDNGAYHIFKGDEDPVSATEPNLIPDGTIKLGVIDVYGDSVSGTTPVDLSGYATKDELNDAIALEVQNRANADDNLSDRIDQTENRITDVENGKEDKSNKTNTITGNETSTSLYASIKGIVDYFTPAKIKSILGITTLSGSNTGDETTASLKPKIDEYLSYALSGETSNLTVGNLISFRMPYAMTLSEVRINVNDAPTVSSIIVDVKEGATSIFSTLVSIDASELTSTTAATPAVISDANLADDALITVSTTQIGSGNAGKGLKILFIGKKA